MIDSSKLKDNLIQDRYRQTRSDRIFLIVLCLMSLIVITIAYLNAFVFMLVQVDGESMLPTFDTGDVVIVNRKVNPQKGDIVIINGEKNDAFIIKRIIAVSGDSIKLENGNVFINDVKIDEPFINEPNSTNPTGKLTEWQIKENEYFFMGDNRKNSKDSRDDEYGTCVRQQIVGVVEEWSIKNMKWNKFLYRLSGW